MSSGGICSIVKRTVLCFGFCESDNLSTSTLSQGVTSLQRKSVSFLSVLAPANISVNPYIRDSRP